MLYCTLLAKTESESERKALKDEMLMDPKKAVVLEAMSDIKSENLVQEERARKAQLRKTKIGAEMESEDALLMEKKGVSEG